MRAASYDGGVLKPMFLRAAVAAGLVATAGCATTPVTPAATATAADGYASVVSAAHPLAAAAGRDMLAAGGSAADAAIAVMLALTVVEPQSSGIGGGGFLVYHDAETGKLYAIDGRETAPAAATADMFIGVDGKPMSFREAVPGGKSVGVPGNIRLAAAAHRRFGKLPWATLFEPAIRIAREGWEVSPRLHDMLARRGELARSTEWAKATFFNADDTPKLAGTTVRNEALAAFLEKLARQGPDAFYRGEDALKLVSAVASATTNPQAMTARDLAGYTVAWRAPLCADYRQWRVCGMPPPSSGATTVIAILKQLERFDLTTLGPDSPVAWHLIAESMRLAYADRDAYIGDPDFVTVPSEGLIDAAYLSARGACIDPARAAATVTAGTPPGAPAVASVGDGEVPSTSHFAAADAAGDVASYTSTIEGVWGSGLTVNGFFLNNELTDFSFAAEANGRLVPNRIEPGKRPRSSMAPTIVYDRDGQVVLAIGAAGGSTIIAQVAKALIGVLDWELDVEAAIALPQIYATGDRVAVEAGSALEPMIPALAAKGHRVAAAALPLKANAVQRKKGRWIGGADPRGEGDVNGVR
jgi:gamma-glutamyltranspeptidase/glutathione hydrolase